MIINDFQKKYHDLILYIGYSYKESIVNKNDRYFYYYFDSIDKKSRSIISGVDNETIYYIYYLNNKWTVGDIKTVFSDILKQGIGNFDFWRNYKLAKLLNGI